MVEAPKHILVGENRQKIEGEWLKVKYRNIKLD